MYRWTLAALLEKLSFPHEAAYTEKEGDALRFTQEAARSGEPLRVYACVPLPWPAGNTLWLAPSWRELAPPAAEGVKQHFTPRPGEPLRVYACGGDGTLNEVVNGAAGLDHVAVTNVPKGTGNDFLKIFGPQCPSRLSRAPPGGGLFDSLGQAPCPAHVRP